MSVESAVSALPGDIVAWLQTQESLSDITFMTEFPAVKKAIPLEKVIVAIGLQSVTLTDKFVEDGNGVLQRQEYCRTAQLRIGLSVHVPFSLSGHTCHEVFSNVVDALSFASDLDIRESGCGNITSDRDTDALVLNGYLQIESDFCPAIASGMQFQSFLDKELLCGTHVRDTDIHVSAAEKEVWAHPTHTGRYMGNGSASRTLSLTFRPSFAAVFAEDHPLTEANLTTGDNCVYAGQATRAGGSIGLALTDDGFRVSQGGSGFQNSIPYLNAVGNIYYYIALP